MSVNIKEIPVVQIKVSNENVRKDLNSEDDETNLDNLANDIKQNGLINPITVREIVDEKYKYEVFAGQRRLLACRLLNWETIHCVIKNVSDVEAEIISLSENVQRNKMSTKDKVSMIAKLHTHFNKDMKKLSDTVSLSVSTLKQYLKISDGLSEEMMLKLDSKDDKLTISTALKLSELPEDQQEEIHEAIKELGTSKQREQAIKFFQKNPETDIDKIVDNIKTESLVTMKLAPDYPWIYGKNGDIVRIPGNLFSKILELIESSSNNGQTQGI